MRPFVYLLLPVILLMAGCNGFSPEPLPTSIPPTPAKSQWGPILTLAITDQADAPTFQSEHGTAVFAWVGSDVAGVHQDVRILNDQGLSNTLALPLSPIQPDKLTLIPSPDDNDISLLFYLDVLSGSNANPRLFVAAFGLDRQLISGPILISTRRTENYTVLRDPGGIVWAIWNGGLPGEPTLYAQSLDSLGRPRPPLALAEDVKFPVVGEDTDGAPLLYWLRSSTGQVYRARWINGQLQNAVILAENIRLEPGERLVNFSVGQDSAYGYLFWNTITADGTPHTWIASGLLSASHWQPPVLLKLIPGDMPDFVTDYNGGAAYSTGPGNLSVTWLAPAQNHSVLLPTAGQVGDELAVVYFQNGEVVAYQTVTTLDRPLLGLPALNLDREQHLALAWSEPTSDDRARLQFTTTRP